MSGFLADEDDFDRRSLLRLGTWGVASVGAVIVAVLANQSSIGMRREQVASADLARQSQQIQLVAKESQNETRRLASAIDTLSGDRDRLYSRVSVVEQGLDAVTGSIAQKNTTAMAPQPAAASVTPPPSITALLPTVQQNPPPVVVPVTTTVVAVADKPKPDGKPPEPATATVASIAPSASTTSSASPPAANPPAATPPPFMASKSVMAPPDAAASKLIEPAAPVKATTAASAPDVMASITAKDSVPVPKDSVAKDGPAKVSPAKESATPDASSTPPSNVAVQRTEFAVDVGGANSVGGLRALWQGLLKSKSNAPLTALHPIIVVKESSTGLGMQLRLAAGPLSDAAAAAKICAAMIENQRTCETTVFDGQRLAMKAEDSDKPVSDKPGSDKAASVEPDAVKHTVDNPVLMRPGSGKQYSYRRYTTKRMAPEDPPKKPESTASTISSFFTRR